VFSPGFVRERIMNILYFISNVYASNMSLASYRLSGLDLKTNINLN